MTLSLYFASLIMVSFSSLNIFINGYFEVLLNLFTVIVSLAFFFFSVWVIFPYFFLAHLIFFVGNWMV